MAAKLSDSSDSISDSSSSSSDDESGEASGWGIDTGIGGIQPYLYEPRAPPTHTEADVTLTGRDEQAEADVRLGNTNWCECGNCVAMGSSLECLCCREVAPAVQRMEANSKTCVTELEGFQVNCLNIHVLEASFYEYLAVEHGLLGDDEEIHKMYRHVAYRRFTRYIWKLLGKRVRRVIPSCATAAIRRMFPSENYTNFKYPRP